MKKFFSSIGLLAILCLSFFYTEKITSVVKEYDDIMVEIKKENELIKINAIDAKIEENTIIPGVSGREIDVNKSYSKMKRYGKYVQNLIVYKKVLPNISLQDNLDKYVIGGNPTKLKVSLIFIVEKDTNINNILKILNSNNVKGNFFIDGNWLENNNELLINLINNGHNIGNLSYSRDYTNSSYTWTDTIIKKVANQNFSYCYSEIDNNITLKLCSAYNNYTIRPNIIIDNTPLKIIQEKLSSGSIISFKINKTLENELDTIIKYIKSKGLKIETLNKHLEE